jgi:hypothetical protein
MIVFGAWAYFFIPETKGRTLEDMDAIFGVPNLEQVKNDRESSIRRVSEDYGDDAKPEIEQHEFNAGRKSHESVRHPE